MSAGIWTATGTCQHKPSTGAISVKKILEKRRASPAHQVAWNWRWRHGRQHESPQSARERQKTKKKADRFWLLFHPQQRWNEIGKTKYDVGQNASKQSTPLSLPTRRKNKITKIKDKRSLPGAWPVEAPHATVERWHGNRLWRWPASTLWHAVPSIIIGPSDDQQRKKNRNGKNEKKELLFER